jgi:hypothetical protein
VPLFTKPPVPENTPSKKTLLTGFEPPGDVSIVRLPVSVPPDVMVRFDVV